MITSLADTVTLNNGTKIPGMGLGVFQIPDEETAKVVEEGIINGYRLIDTAQIYGNESGTGAGIKAGLAATGLNREDLFVTLESLERAYPMMKQFKLSMIVWNV